MRSRILWKLFLAFVVVALVALSLQYADLAPSLRTFLTHHIEQTLTEKASIVRDRLEAVPAGNLTVATLKPLADRLADEIGTRVTIVAADGRVLGDSEQTADEIARMDNHLTRPEIQAALTGSIGTSQRYSVTLGTDMLYVASRASHGFVRVALPLRAVGELAWQVKRSALRSALEALALACIVAFFLARSAGRSLRQMTGAANQIARGDFSRRLLLDRRDELGDLATSINAMAGDLERQFAELTGEKAQLKAILEGMVEGVLVTDGDGRIVLTNAALQAMLGLSRDCLGSSVIECVRNEVIHEAVAGVLTDAMPREEAIIIRTAYGEKHFLLHAVPLREEAARFGCVAVLHDVTRMRELENVRREFVANVSHELKTPLTNILGFSETLRRGALGDSSVAADFVAKIEKNARRLSDLVEEILRISEIESGRLALSPVAIDLRELVEALHADLMGRLASTSLTLENNVPQGVYADADPSALRQILGNLLDNALKFTPAGGSIEISAEHRDGLCRIVVSDTGLGIPEKDLPHIFERFYRVDRSRSGEAGGAGLGLAIVKHLVQAHGGEVHAENRAGGGASFSVMFPLVAPKTERR